MAKIVFAGLVLILFLSVFNRIKMNSSERRREAEVNINGRIFNAEVVRSASEQARGLAGRGEMADREGMLFLFSKPGKKIFWMKGMKMPIDIVWISAGKIVALDEDVPAEPDVPFWRLKHYPSPGPVDSVLETAAGAAGKAEIKVGDPVRIENI
jgi:hypothetical protein